MNLKPIARWTGAAYLTLAVAGGFTWLGARGQLFVAGDPTETLSRLTENPGLAQLGLAADVLTVVTQALAGLGFFALIRRDRPVAALGVASFGLANALTILTGALFNVAALAVVAQPSLAPGGDAAATVSLLYTLSGAAWTIGNVFFGLWLIPMGWFVVSTRRMPRPLGWFLMAGGVGYVLAAFVGVLAPDLAPTLGNVLPLPATVGELWMVGYLLSLGIRPAVVPSTADAA